MTDRTDRFMARIASHLPSLPSNAARRAFLTAQIEAWETKYSRFISTEGDSHRTGDAPDQPVAADFVSTILALQKEQTKYSQEIAA